MRIFCGLLSKSEGDLSGNKFHLATEDCGSVFRRIVMYVLILLS